MKLIKEQWNEVIEDFKNGLSLKELSEKYNCSTQTIGKHLKALGVKSNRQCKWVNDTYFDEIDTEEKAYLLGFFIADGCIRVEFDRRLNNIHGFRLCFTNSIDDEDIIKLIHERICPNNKLQYVHNTKGAKNRKPQITVQWTANHMVEVLKNKYKILPNKTNDKEFEFPFDTIPEELHRHFVRGFMDGDGSINKSELRFAFTSEPFMNQILSKFTDLFKKHEDTVWDFSYTITPYQGKTTNYWTVFIPMGHGRDKLIKNYLYKDSSIYLERKYNKAYGKNE